jgi:imidazolonepropionase-like amidohydrolase
MQSIRGWRLTAGIATLVVAPACNTLIGVGDLSSTSSIDAASGQDAASADASPGTGDAGIDASTTVDATNARVTPGASDRILLRGTLLTPTGAQLGEVLIEGTTITCVAASCAGSPGAPGATIVDTGGVISPGLINSQDHVLFDAFDSSDWTPATIYGNHNMWTSEARYTQVVNAKQYLNHESGSPVDVGCELDKYSEARALMHGTTSVTMMSTSRACDASLARSIDVLQNDLGADHVQVATLMPATSAAQSVCSNFVSGATTAYVAHVAEGSDATALAEFDTFSALATGCLLDPRTAIVEGNALGTPAFQAMAAHSMKLVWTPRTNLTLYNQTARIDLAMAAGVSVIALGTEWSLTGSSNLLDELRTARTAAQAEGVMLSARRLHDMVTIDAARVLGVDAALGSLEVGKRADLAVFAGASADPYEDVIAANAKTVMMTIVDGRVLYGDADLVTAAPAAPGCETRSVCGATKFICVAEGSSADLLDQTLVQITTNLANALTAYDSTTGAAPLMPLAPLAVCQ